MKELNAEHVDRLNTIDKLRLAGFKGMDHSLTISLFEYGLAWRDLGDETLFIYAHPTKYNRFDRCTIANNTVAEQEWDWADFETVASCHGCETIALLSAPLIVQVEMLCRFYGAEEIFGTSYWEGFTIEK